MHDRDVRLVAGKVSCGTVRRPRADSVATHPRITLLQPDVSRAVASAGRDDAAFAALLGATPAMRAQILASLQRRHGNRHVARALTAARSSEHEQPRCSAMHSERECDCGCRARSNLVPERCDLTADNEEESVSRPAISSVLQAPRQGDATIVCDGAGGYRADLRGWATAGCGIAGCVQRHEESHAADWRGRWPNGCRNPDGTNKPNGSSIPLGGPGYDAFLRRSECTAYTVEETCVTGLLGGASASCRPQLQSHLADTRAQKATYC